MDTKDFLSALIVTYNDSNLAKKACESILNNTKKYPVRLYVVDNFSSDNTRELLENIDGVNLVRLNKNIGFGAAHNKILDLGLGKYHFVINPDIEIQGDALSDMADFMEENGDIALAIPKILNPDKTEQKLCRERPTFKRLFLGRLSRLGGIFKKISDEYRWADREITEVCELDFCSGCFMCFKGEVFKALGGFDERFFMYLEDADITLRTKKYGKTVAVPNITVIHKWQRDSAKKLRYLFIHLISCLKFLTKRRENI